MFFLLPEEGKGDDSQESRSSWTRVAQTKTSPCSSSGISQVFSLFSRGRPSDRRQKTRRFFCLHQVRLPFGGLKEKALAAKRSGIKKVIIPKGNEPFLRELSDEIKKSLAFVFADTIEDVLKHALVK